jgi:hypothetical protein
MPMPIIPAEQVYGGKSGGAKPAAKSGRGTSIIPSLIIPIGVVALGYYVLKTWKVIGTASLDFWEALPEEDLTYLEELVDSI